MSEIDWASLQQEAAKAGLIPEGDYNVIIEKTDPVRSSTGKPMIKYKARVLDGPQKDKTIYGNLTLTTDNPMALRMYFLQMAAFGLDSSFFAQNPKLADVASALERRCVVFTITIQPYQGADRSNVNGIKPLPAGIPLPPGAATGPATLAGVGGAPVPGAPVPPASSMPTAPTTPPVPSASSSIPTIPVPPAQPF